MADLLTGYTYDKGSQRYRNSDTGRFVSRSTVTSLLDQQVGKLESRLDNLYDAYAKGDITPGVYAERMRTEVRRAHLQQAALAKGGWEQLDQSDYGRVGQALKQIYPKIVGTTRDIQNGDVSEAQAKQRNVAYAGSGRRVHYAIEQNNAKAAEPGKIMVEQRILDPQAQHCEGCLNYAEMGIQRAGTLPVPGDACRCGDNCRCGIRRWEMDRGEFERAVGNQRESSGGKWAHVYDGVSHRIETKDEPMSGKIFISHEMFLQESAVPLVESCVRADGTAPVKLIAPGWGSKGYYPADVIRRDGPKAFPKGTKMFWDHATITEETERPEGTLNRLAAELVTDPIWQESGPKGPGLYADAKVFNRYKDDINDMGPHIGVSIRSKGRGKAGTAEGRKGRIVTSIFSADEARANGIIPTVDFVTVAGAGGEIIELFESAGGRKPEPLTEGIGKMIRRALGESGQSEEDFIKNVGIDEAHMRDILSGDIDAPSDEHMRQIADHLNINMDRLRNAHSQQESFRKENHMELETQLKEAQAAIQKLQETNAQLLEQNARTGEALLLRDARDFVVAQLATSDLPAVTKGRLTESLSANPPIADGKLDKDAYKTAISEAVTGETEYLREAAGYSSGRISNMGSSFDAGVNDGQFSEEDSERRLSEAFASMGLDGKALEFATSGRKF